MFTLKASFSFSLGIFILTLIESFQIWIGTINESSNFIGSNDDDVVGENVVKLLQKAIDARGV